MTEPSQPSWKFWGDLPLWKVILVFLVCNLAVTLVFVAVREGLKIDVPQWPAGGIGAVLSIVVVSRMRGVTMPNPPVV